MSKQRYEISICYVDSKNVKRYQNNVGSLFFDGERGSIVLAPGIALTGGATHYINVGLPFEKGDRAQGGGRGRQAQGGGGYGPVDDGTGDDIPFSQLRGEL